MCGRCGRRRRRGGRASVLLWRTRKRRAGARKTMNKSHCSALTTDYGDELHDYRYFRDKVPPWIKFHPLPILSPSQLSFLTSPAAEQCQASCFSRFRIHPVLDIVWHNLSPNTFWLHIYLHSNICIAQPRCSTIIFTLQDSNLFAAVSETLFWRRLPFDGSRI